MTATQRADRAFSVALSTYRRDGGVSIHDRIDFDRSQYDTILPDRATTIRRAIADYNGDED